jgi:hypothetical protein
MVQGVDPYVERMSFVMPAGQRLAWQRTIRYLRDGTSRSVRDTVGTVDGKPVSDATLANIIRRQPGPV